ncbi:hypothetical protein EAI_06977, partial [Harpegnathos saltator]
VWTDESTFTPNGVFNSRNFLLWQEENPHAIQEGAFQYRWSINVWAGVNADRVVSIIRLKKLLSRNDFLIFHNFQIGLLEDVSLQARAELIFQHDGAPTHFSRQVRDILDTRFSERWVG